MSNWLIECRNCGEEFEKYQWNQKNCYDCLEKLDPRFKGRPKRDCVNCGESFQPRVIRQEACSSACRDKYRTKMYFFNQYGLTEEQYKGLMSSANHKCQICYGDGFVMNNMRHKAKLVVDHDHATGEVRGVLCHNCNRALGLLQDDPKIVSNAVKYLENNP